jgi:hypothetical protein
MTAQIPDVLEYHGQTYRLYTNPLDALQDGRRPTFAYENSALWRGYVACWEILNDRLYLKDLHGRLCTRSAEQGARRANCGTHHGSGCIARDVQLSDLFGQVDRIDGMIFAEWFSGELKVPQGKMLEYVHMGYGSRYERYLIFDIVDGVVVASRVDSGKQPATVRRGFPGWIKRRRS